MIRTWSSDKHIVKELKFGKGDIHCRAIWNDNFAGLGFYQIEEGEVGRQIKPTADRDEFLNEEVQLMMTFSSIDSLNVTIKNLEGLRKRFEESKKDEQRY